MLLRLQKYDLTIKYISGKHLYIADTLSRAHGTDCSEDIDSAEIQLAVHTVVKDLPITDERLIDLQEATKLDSTLTASETLYRTWLAYQHSECSTNTA